MGKRLFRTSLSVAVGLVLLSMASIPPIPALKTTPTMAPTTTAKTTTTPTTTVCADGWDFFPETYSCYFIPKTTEKKDMKPWRAAKSFCEQLAVNGSEVPRLVDITSEEEQKFLEQTITKYKFDDQDYWTGGHDFVSEGEWAWAGTNHTHSSANYTNWDAGQPVKGSGWNHQDCLFLGHQKRFQHRWHDNPCSYSCNYICEYSPPLVVPLPASAASSEASSSFHTGVVVAIVVFIILLLLAAGALVLLLGRRSRREYRRPGHPGTLHSEIFGAMTEPEDDSGGGGGGGVSAGVGGGADDDERITSTTSFVARFRRGLGWRQVAETDKRTLVENIVISIENDVGGRGRDDSEGVEREEGSCVS